MPTECRNLRASPTIFEFRFKFENHQRGLNAARRNAMASITKQIEQIRRSAEKMDAAAPAKIGSASAGDVVRQGDLYFICLDVLPTGKTLKDRQLAPGTSQGSRHLATGKCLVLDVDKAAMAATINRLVKGSEIPQQLVGPALVCTEETTITHPEHGWRTLEAGSAWATVFQRQYAEEIRRVQD
jgi:hypothetical protein